MPQEYIEVRGARENNLKSVSLRIPKRKITIFTGVSGSGKSSIGGPKGVRNRFQVSVPDPFPPFNPPNSQCE